MTTTLDTLNAFHDGGVTLLAETDRAAELAAFAENILSPGTGTNFAPAPEVRVHFAQDVTLEHAAAFIAGIGDIALR